MARRTVDPVGTDQRRLTMSYEEWLAWDNGAKLSEWDDGEVITFMPPSGRHQDILLFLASLLEWYVRTFRLGTLRIAPFEMRLSERASREPDILFIAHAHHDRLTPQRLLGPADLAIELISNDSVRRDRIEKLQAYEAAGIPEYWLFDPRPGRQTASFYQLTDGKYRPAPPGADGRYHALALSGFWLRPAWLWQDPLPDHLACLVEIAPQAVRGALNSIGPAGGTDGA